MGANEQLTIAEKLRKIRERKGVIQSSLADALYCDVSRISEIERGKKEYTDEQITTLRTLLDIEDVPLTEAEMKKFRKRFYVWRDLIRERRIAEAKELHCELSVISKLPFEEELNLMYKMFEASQRLRQDDAADNLSAIKEMLDECEPLIEKAPEEIKHYFYCNKGFYSIFIGDNKESVKYYSIAINTKDGGYDKEPAAYYNLGLGYTNLGNAVRAISILLKAYNLFDHKRTTMFGLAINNTLATNYIRTNQVELALKVLYETLDKASELSDKAYLDITLHNIGCTYLQSGEYEKSVQYFDSAFLHIEKSNDLYLENFYAKIHTLIVAKNKSLYFPLLLKAKRLAQGSDHYTLLFESLSHLLTLKKAESIEFIEGKTMPYLLGEHDYYKALNFCDVLYADHIKNNRGKKASDITTLKVDILAKILFGGDSK